MLGGGVDGSPGAGKGEEREQEEPSTLLPFRDLTLLVIGQVSRVKFNCIPISD